MTFAFFKEIPDEILVRIFSLLDLENITCIQQVSRRFAIWGFDKSIWHNLFQKYFGVQITLDDKCRDKFIIHYLFQKGKSFKVENNNKEAKKYWDKAIEFLKLSNIDEFHDETDKAWIEYIYGELELYYYFGRSSEKVLNGQTRLLKAAKLGNPNAMLALAFLHLKPEKYPDLEGVTRNPDLGKKYLYQAFQNGKTEAAYILIEEYTEDIINLDDFSENKDVKLLEAAADRGSKKAIEQLIDIWQQWVMIDIAKFDMDLGFQRYLDDVRDNFDNLEEIVKRAHVYALKGSYVARKTLKRWWKFGDIQFGIKSGMDLIRDCVATFEPFEEKHKFIFLLQKAIAWETKESIEPALKLAKLCFEISSMKENGALTNSAFAGYAAYDKEKGVEYLKKAIALGSNEAMYEYACICKKGFCHSRFSKIYLKAQRNINEAIKYFEEAAKFDDRYATLSIKELIDIYSSNQFGIAISLEKIEFWSRKGLEKGDTDFLMTFGRYYLKGNEKIKLQANIEKAEEIFQEIFSKSVCGEIACSIALEYQFSNNLDNYLKWSLRAIKFGSLYYANALVNLFKCGMVSDNGHLYKEAINFELADRWQKLIAEHMTFYYSNSETQFSNSFQDEFLKLVEDTYHVLSMDYTIDPYLHDGFNIENSAPSYEY